jgi:hypothetical protein
VVLPIVALIGALVRWQVQGSRNLYTAFSKRFYIPDPDLGWRISERHPIWLGLEVCAVIATVAVGLLVGGWIIRRREARRREARRGGRATILRAVSWIVAGVPLAVPIAAFASGVGPENGLDTLPAATIQGIEAGMRLEAEQVRLHADDVLLVLRRGHRRLWKRVQRHVVLQRHVIRS